ncbi:rhodanese-like domain-containing protein [Kribbella shirazensis]|uniref:Rhodanese-related sulfurtransferase n=1 Tax=Kribbella shirazensis TaxID=1105143 RepID=A0A7X6A1Q7_9ACTN|nr:rhodanese-like domain-containing protein [Kribbella shirazensis]NIK58502.1 rhodanese-related sulfurtransferase [Kribbella shirazensis]
MTGPEAVPSLAFDQVERWRESAEPHALLDVRERGEYALGQIPGACPLPRGLLEILLPRLVPWPDVPVVLYSRGEHRSRLAAKTCRELGYRSVFVLDSGIDGWSRAQDRSPAYGVNVLGKTFGERLSIEGEVEQLDPDKVAPLIESGTALVIDARTASEYAKGHLPGAVNIPSGELVQTLLRAGVDRERDRQVIVHCAGRTRSIVGAYLLRQAGFENAYALRNGTMAWRMSGRDLDFTPHDFGEAGHDPRAVAFAERFADLPAVRPVSADDLAARPDPVYVIDVRQPHEYAEGHLPGALNCPAGQLANAVDEQLAVRDALLVCYSGDETRSQLGAGLLARIGYRRVAWLAGGLNAWRAAGRPVAPGPAKAYLDELDFGQDVPTVDTTGLEARLDQDDPPTVIDVRRSSEFALSHIPGSVWMPRGDLERRIGTVAERYDPLVVVSDRGLRSALAVRTLVELGFHDVVHLQGGLVAWTAAGGAMVEGLDGADVSLREAKEDAELVAPRPALLERNRDDMVRYLDWEERLGAELAAGTGEGHAS